MLRSAARRLLKPLRRFNRWWIDRLDPDWPAKPAPAAPAQQPVRAADPVPQRKTREKATGPISIWAEATPNPDAVKFTCSVQLVDAPVTWQAGDRTGDELGSGLLAIPGVRSAFAVGDFVTVTRVGGVDWTMLQPAIEDAIEAAVS